MRAVFEAIRFPESSSIRCFFTASERFGGARWHFHPEIEIIFIEHSRGLRFVGDHIGAFREGDLVLLGPNLPHVWLAEPGRGLGYVRAVVVQFPKAFLGREFWETPEFAAMAELIRRSNHGLFFGGEAAGEIASRLLRMPETGPVRRVLLLLEVLDLMANSVDQTVLCSAQYLPKVHHLDAHRIESIRRYIEENLLGEISQPAAAALVRMSPEGFCRYFRQKMGCKFSTYVNQLRISRAIHLMVEEEMNISEACFASGFNSLSTFNHQFLAIKGVTPSEFLKQLNRSAARPPLLPLGWSGS